MQKPTKKGKKVLMIIFSFPILILLLGLCTYFIGRNHECKNITTCKFTYGLITDIHQSSKPFRKQVKVFYYINTKPRYFLTAMRIDEIRNYGLDERLFYKIEYDSVLPNVLKFLYKDGPVLPDSVLSFYKQEGVEFNIADLESARQGDLWEFYREYFRYIIGIDN